ncbi:MAG: NACHT domain-containing protein [Cyanobacteria bacterium P01_D01_bin.156]
MVNQHPQESNQEINIVDSSLEKVQIGGQANRDLYLNQIQGDVINLSVIDHISACVGFGQQSSHELKTLTYTAYRQRRVLLNKVKLFWIKGVLEKALHHPSIIELALTRETDAVQHPFDGIDEFSDQSKKKIRQDTEIIDIFENMGTGRTLLLLGEPGSGKTTTLLKLTRTLINRIEDNLSQPIPVVFNLSSWVNNKLFSDWLIEELYSKYQIPKNLGHQWIENQDLILMLDGLDEVKNSLRNECVQELNEFIQTHGMTEIVVCCRLAEYKKISNKLRLHGAICLQPLTCTQVMQYLSQKGDKLKAVKDLLQKDTELQDFARNPLILNIISLAYQDQSVEDIEQTRSMVELRELIFRKYINRVINRKLHKQKYAECDSLFWLTWLAKKMKEESKTIFFVEELQPTVLNNNQKNTYKIFSQTTLITIYALLFLPSVIFIDFLILHNSTRLFQGILGDAVIALILGIISSSSVEEIRLVEKIDFSWSRALKGMLFYGLILGPTIGTFYDLLTRGIIFKFRKAIRFIDKVRQYTALIGAFIGFISGVITSTYNSVYYAWDLTSLMHNIIQILLSIVTIISASIVGLLSGYALLSFGWLLTLIWFLAYVFSGTVAGAVEGIKCGLSVSKIKTKTYPNEGLIESVKNSLMIGLVVGLISAVIIYPVVKVVANAILVSIFIGTSLGLLTLFIFGGQAFSKYFLLRVFLYHKGLVPWHYSDFLDYASERIILQKVGGGYIFIHRMLLEYFTEIEMAKKPSPKYF